MNTKNKKDTGTTAPEQKSFPQAISNHEGVNQHSPGSINSSSKRFLSYEKDEDEALDSTLDFKAGSSSIDSTEDEELDAPMGSAHQNQSQTKKGTTSEEKSRNSGNSPKKDSSQQDNSLDKGRIQTGVNKDSVKK